MSRDPERIDEILTELRKLWKKHPDLRLGQLIDILINVNPNETEMFYIEDDKWLKWIKEGIN